MARIQIRTGPAWRRFRSLLVSHELDPDFREVVVRQGRIGMSVTGRMAIGLVVAYLLVGIVEGRRIVLIPGEGYGAAQMALLDKLVIVALAVLCLLASKTLIGGLRARAIVAFSAVAIVVAMVLDDAARQDPSLSPVYVILTMTTVAAAMPFRPAQTLILSMAVIASFHATFLWIAPLLGYGRTPFLPGHLRILILAGALATVLSLFLYNLRFHQYRARRKVEKLKQRVEIQTESLKRRNKLLWKVFGRYLTDDVVKHLVESPEGLRLGGKKQVVTILMADIRGFSSLSESLDPQEVVSLLNTHLESMTGVIEAFAGTIDEFIGDAIMVIFGAPLNYDDDAFRAVACAVAMQAEMENVNRANLARGLPRIEIGIALHTGEVIVGNIGSERRAKYGVVGPVVNLACRIESYSVGGQILISEATHDAVLKHIQVVNEISVEPKGVTEPIRIFDVVGVGPPYNLSVPARSTKLITLGRRLPVAFSILEEKFVGRTVHRGSFTALSLTQAIVSTDVCVPPLSNLRFEVADESSTPIGGDMYAKVIAVDDHAPRCRVHFTTLSATPRAFIEKSLVWER